MVMDDLVAAVSEDSGYAKAPCAEIIKSAFKVMSKELAGYGYVYIKSFGRFEVQSLKDGEYEVKDNETGGRRRVQVKGRKRIKFSPSEVLKRKIK